MSIRVSQLLKQYGTQKAVNQVSFELTRGEIVGFLGPNGAGKSTTLKMITGYLQPDSGHALVEGMDVTAHPLEVKRMIGYLPEANPLYYEMYVREYLHFIGGIHQLPRIRKSVQEVIELTGLTLEAGKKIGQLSKGYKQRVGLAAALIHDPKVLILDEPTSGLDPNQILEIREVIRKQGTTKTVLFSSHILQEVEAICDRVIIINKGRLVADSTLADLRKGHTRQQAVIVSFQEPVLAEWLQNLPGVIQAMQSPGDQSWQLQTENAEQVRKQLLELTIERHLNIVSLQTESQSLEQVFRQLTADS
ncbi:MAG TPA: gliding motility-associated ABC transporter ATP-binding subunit GldA [Sediminibacterium sp.]|nr:gliding motility-associated ABC transporter ATP-binding subunit GldA [Sediminibacterium sp.]